MIHPMTWLANLLNFHKIQITPVKKTDEGVIIRIQNGKASLRGEFRAYKDRGMLSLSLNGVPLVKFHGDVYFCPTCEKLVSAGYGLNTCDNGLFFKLSDALNSPFESIEVSLETLKPLLGLLQDGYYLIADMELFPTDGNDSFFWNVTNTEKLNPASGPTHDRMSSCWGTPTPKYVLPTQSPRLFNEVRAQHYRNNTASRAVAYYTEGYLCALLDGHHKATAAALDGREVKSIVIVPEGSCSFPTEENNHEGKVYFTQQSYLTASELGCSIKQYAKIRSYWKRIEETSETFLTHVNHDFDDVQWPKYILNTAKHYYNVHLFSCIGWAGDISPTRLNRITGGNEEIETESLCHIINALYATKAESFVPFCIDMYKKGCEPEVLYTMFPVLAQIHSQEVEDFFVDFCVNDEGLRPRLTKIANDYFIVTD